MGMYCIGAILLAVILILLLCYGNKRYDYFVSNTQQATSTSTATLPEGNTQTQINAAKMTINTRPTDILNDPLFEDVTLYNNTYDENENIIEIGMIDCIKKCKGNCVEFGVLGYAYCFPEQ